MSTASFPENDMDTQRIDADGALWLCFEERVKRFPQKVAIESPQGCLTYEALCRLANGIARRLLGESVPEGSPVALFFDQGPGFISAALGCLKAGRAFVPLDPTYPSARNQCMLADASAGRLLTSTARYEEALAIAQKVSAEVAVMNCEDRCEEETREEGGNLGPLAVPGQQLAYILYTSGSTGRPKGVMHTHRNLLHNAQRHIALFQIKSEDRLSLIYPCSVYGGIRDIFNALLSGATLFHFPVREKGYTGLRNWLLDHHITIYCSVVTVFRHFAQQLEGQNLFPDLRLVKLGGEASHPSDVSLFRKHFSSNAILHCGLGSTETGISRQYPITATTRFPDSGVPLGFSVQGLDVILLDEEGVVVPQGEVGEITIESRYISTGYYGRPDLNEKQFSVSPRNPSRRVFRTGDLGRFLEDDCLIHCGRKDTQVKVRGNRVEILEVEAALLHHAAIEDVVVSLSESERGVEELVAQLVLAQGEKPTVHELREYLKEKLPRFMIPQKFLAMDALALTPNGKKDRQAPCGQGVLLDFGDDFSLPQSKSEEQLLAIWSKSLGFSDCSMTENFFDLGGDSLMAVAMLVEVEKLFGISLSPDHLLEYRSIRDLAKCLDEGGTGDAAGTVTVLQSFGEKPPLFVLAGKGGSTYSYRGVAQLLEHDQPVYGLQYPLCTSAGEPIHTMNELVTELKMSLLQFQPEGPYQLLGYSFGGLVAYELAWRLRSEGKQVSYLGLVDTFAPGARRSLAFHRRLRVHLRRLIHSGLSEELGTLMRKIKRLSSVHRRKQDSAGIDSESRLEGRLQQMLRMSQRVTAGYTTARPSEFSLWVYQCAEAPDWIEFMDVEKFHGWKRWVTGALHLKEIPGWHLEIFESPNIEPFAEAIQADLRAAHRAGH